MKKFFSVLETILPHIVIDLAMCFAVFLVLNHFNPMMAFLSNKYSRVLLAVFCVSALAESIFLIVRQRKE